MNRQYLGDSVYVEVEGGMLKLTTDNGEPQGPNNTIFLELQVFESLQRYVIALIEEIEKHADA